MVPRCSQSVPARLNQRACSWHITDWRLWHDGTSDERPNEGWKLSASLFIKKEVGLRIIWNGLGWVELLQKLWREQLAALNRHWIIWSGVTARSIRVLRQFAASTLLKNEDCLLDPTIPPGWTEFLRRLQACQLAVFKTARISGVESLHGTSGSAGSWLPRVSRRQAEEVPHHQRLWEGGFCCGIANCHHERCDPTALVITTVFALGVIRLVW